MTEENLIKTLKELKKELKKDFGPYCKDMNMDCPSCKARILDAYLDWWLSIENFAQEIKLDKHYKK